MVLVVDTLLDRLCLLQAIADVLEESSAFLHLLSHRSNASLAGLIRADGRGIPAVDHPERGVAKRSLEGGVVGVFRPR